ncbi:MAG: hypothetical protein M3Q23_10655 [Actinomycetota bacterium]|nr:hypothetical protein [Actinomycetota bacterium]
MRAVRARLYRESGPRFLGRTPSAVPIKDGTASTSEVLDAVVREGAWLPAAEVIPPKRQGTVGAPRTYPEFTWTLLEELLWVIGSASTTKLMRELGRGGVWRTIRKKLRRHWPELPELPHDPPARQTFEYYLDRYLANSDETMERRLQRHAKVSTQQAIEAGNFDPAGGGSSTHPTVERTVYGDGKVIDAQYKSKPGTTRVNRKTGEVRPVRFDPDAWWYAEGGGDLVWGIKFAVLSTRRAEGHFILGFEHVAKDHDEAKAALTMLRRIKPYAPGAQAVVWDMILRGAHITVIMTEVGLVAVVGVHAQENPDGKKGRQAGTYVPRTEDLDDVEVTMPDGTVEVLHLAAHDGWLSIKDITESGEPHYEHLVCTRIQRHQDKKGFRFYGYFKLPAEYGGKVIVIRLFQNEDDTRRRINRSENLRAIPEGSEDFRRLHVLRPDAESVNAMIERALAPVNGRAPAKGWRRLLALLLGWARMVNAVTLARCRARAGPRVAA